MTFLHELLVALLSVLMFAVMGALALFCPNDTVRFRMLSFLWLLFAGPFLAAELLLYHVFSVLLLRPIWARSAYAIETKRTALEFVDALGEYPEMWLHLVRGTDPCF